MVATEPSLVTAELCKGLNDGSVRWAICEVR